jgi:hypothetical protein
LALVGPSAMKRTSYLAMANSGRDRPVAGNYRADPGLITCSRD